MSSVPTMPDTPSTRCRLLELAPELRNEIYDPVYTHDTRRFTLSLMRRQEPQKALLLTCKLINNEAGGVYHAAFRSYVESTVFCVHGKSAGESYVRSEACLDDDIAHINILSMHACIDTEGDPLYDAITYIIDGCKTQFRTKRCFIKYFTDYEIGIRKRESGGEDVITRRTPLPVVSMSKDWLLEVLDRCSWLDHDETCNDEDLLDPLNEIADYGGYQTLNRPHGKSSAPMMRRDCSVVVRDGYCNLLYSFTYGIVAELEDWGNIPNEVRAVANYSTGSEFAVRSSCNFGSEETEGAKDSCLMRGPEFIA
ncbi:hypothetical protein B0A48_12376 [Cryoendolithus antarcticus]|uniref:Uncharacterized protein n=1 Tax=Cryoendolithus antarcticus TaxID=1507870 RepID=A0A1V8SRW2_9PEZI|nr:hypothetical protein B0A48_12376 [Cryoendolithus antarcticus]